MAESHPLIFVGETYSRNSFLRGTLCNSCSIHTQCYYKSLVLISQFGFFHEGEVGKEMYICARGRLEVVVDNGKTVLATLRAGSYFGEISILNMGAAGKKLHFHFRFEE